jgi:hypothetical protein
VRGLRAELHGTTISLVLVGTLTDTHIVGVIRQFVRRAKTRIDGRLLVPSKNSTGYIQLSCCVSSTCLSRSGGGS